MITYKIDKHPQAKAAVRIRDMKSILDEIPITLQMLDAAIDDQAQTISSPSIDQFREELKQTIADAVMLTTILSQDSQYLLAVSEQVSKHLLAVEDHYGGLLRNRTAQTARV